MIASDDLVGLIVLGCGMSDEESPNLVAHSQSLLRVLAPLLLVPVINSLNRPGVEGFAPG
jgi:hypothetical protein